MKIAITADAAAALIPDGARLLIGGFMGAGSPHRLIDALVRRGAKNLTVIANDTAWPGRGIGKLISAGAVAKLVASHIGLNPETQARMIAGEIEVELAPQGTLIERIRAGGVGLGGVLTATGIGTLVEKGKRIIEVDGKPFLLETPIRGDFALIAAKRRLLRQSRIFADRAQFQSGDRARRRRCHRRAAHDRAGRRHPA
jgi:acetate CoA/acetoacetate CoA-transferase alpha subunit